MAQTTNNNLRGISYTLSSGLMYGLVGFFGIKLMENGLSISNMLFWRFLVASIINFALFIPKRKIEMQQINSLQVFYGFMNGLLFYSASSILYFMSAKYIGTGLSIVIFFTYPIFVAILSWFFDGHKVTKIHYFSIGLIILGSICLIDRGEVVMDISGIILAFIASCTYGLYIFASKKQIKSLTPLMSTFTVCIANTILFFVFSLVDGSFMVPHGTINWIYIFGMANLCTVFPILFLLEGLKYISASKASILSVLEPVFVVLIGVAFLGETIGTMQIVGMLVILTSALVINFEKKTPAKIKK